MKKRGEFVVYHKNGVVSVRLGDFLRSPEGRRQIAAAKAARDFTQRGLRLGRLSQAYL